MKLAIEGTEEEIQAFAKKLVGVDEGDTRLARGYVDALRALASRNKIDAIKVHRNTTGCFLVEARDYVEGL